MNITDYTDFKKITQIFLVTFILTFNSVSLSFAEKRLESNYFTVYLQKEMDLITLAKKLDIHSEYLLSTSFLDRPEDVLAKILDAIFLEVSDILDIHLLSFKGSIKISQDFEELKKVFKDLFSQELTTHSFYVYNSNTIYIDAQNIKPEILAHEIAHAIINRYFVIPPPIKLQEILAKYVEYRIKKLVPLK